MKLLNNLSTLNNLPALSDSDMDLIIDVLSNFFSKKYNDQKSFTKKEKSVTLSLVTKLSPTAQDKLIDRLATEEDSDQIMGFLITNHPSFFQSLDEALEKSAGKAIQTLLTHKSLGFLNENNELVLEQGMQNLTQCVGDFSEDDKKYIEEELTKSRKQSLS